MDWWVDANVKVIHLTLGAAGSRSVHGVGGNRLRGRPQDEGVMLPRVLPSPGRPFSRLPPSASSITRANRLLPL